MKQDARRPTHALGNNKGGSGKSTLLFQLACEHAQTHPDEETLVVDLSLYSDATTLLMGGTKRPGLLKASRGAQAAMSATTPDTRAEGMLLALAAGEEKVAAGGVGGFFASFNPFVQPPGAAGAAGASELDIRKFAVRPGDVNPTIPGNLLLVASCGELPLAEEDWKAAAERFGAALRLLPSSTAVFIDTDHLANAPVSKMAFATVDRLLVPLSLDDNDFSRMFVDPTGNSLWDVLQNLFDEGLLKARVHKLIFNRVAAVKGAPAEHESGISSPFTPAKAGLEQMSSICSQLYECYRASDFHLFAEGDEVATQRQFNERYVTAFRTASETTMNVAKLTGSPFCSLKAAKVTDGEVTVDLTKQGLQIDALKQGVAGVLKVL